MIEKIIRFFEQDNWIGKVARLIAIIAILLSIGTCITRTGERMRIETGQTADAFF